MVPSSLLTQIRASANSRPKMAADPQPPVGDSRQLKERALIVLQFELDLRMGQGHAGEGLRRVAQFGGRGPQELAADRRVEEQVADLHAAYPGPRHRGPHRRPVRRGPAVRSRWPASATRLRIRRRLTARNRGQGLASEAQRVHVEQIVGRANLAGGVTGDRPAAVVGPGMPAAVVAHATRCDATLLQDHFDLSCCGIDGVFQQLLDHAGGTLNDLAGRDLVDHAGRQRLDGRQRNGAHRGPFKMEFQQPWDRDKGSGVFGGRPYDPQLTWMTERDSRPADHV